jgi:hypothetical protein
MNLKAMICAAAFAVPLQQMNDWQLLQYSGIAPNQVSFTQEGMSIKVMGSASPIIYPLDAPRLVHRIEMTGSLNQLLTLNAEQQGVKGNDDFTLKVGLVIAGDKTLNGMQKWFSADWIRRLYELAPRGGGVDSIYFLNAVQDSSSLGRQRQHPLSELIFENNVWLLDKPGDFALTYSLDRPRQVIAIWISIDGDDSRSTFTTLIRSLQLDGQDVAD